MRGLDGKTAIVAGGATLIGQAVAETLIGYGVNVVIADINEADGEAAADTLGAKARFIRADITQRRRHRGAGRKDGRRRPAGSIFSSTSPAPISTMAPRRRAPTG